MTRSTPIEKSVKISSVFPSSMFNNNISNSLWLKNSGGLLLARLFGRRGRGRVAYAADAVALDLFDDEDAALVLDRLVGLKYAPRLRQKETGHRRVARLFGQLQIKA